MKQTNLSDILAVIFTRSLCTFCVGGELGERGGEIEREKRRVGEGGERQIECLMAMLFVYDDFIYNNAFPVC